MALLGCRDNLVIATKFGHRAPDPVNGPDWGARSGRRYIMRAVEASLRRLRTDYIDLYQIHQPDPDTPVEETLSALNDLVRAGKVRYLGCSQFAGWQVADAAWTAHTAHLTPFVSAQNEYSLLRRDVETELVPACARFGLGLLPFFPLASGLLTGKYRRGEAPAAGTRMSDAAWRDFYANAPWDTIEKVAEFARQRDRSPIDVAIGGLAAKPAVASVIAGATSPAQVRANAGAVTWQPTESELAELDAITAR
jgi:aryl-alcohol dehydrogenase-like predicted oxidoreductase